MTNTLSRWRIAAPGGVLLGLAGGLLAERRPSTAILLCVCVAAVVGLAMLGDRMFPWAIVLVAVAPWYPFVSQEALPPRVAQKVLCAAIAAAPLVPWLWSLALGGRRTRPSRGALLMGVMLGGLAMLIYATLSSVSQLIDSRVVGFLFAGVTFLCARRFTDPRGWLAAGFGGLLILLLLGADAYVSAPGNRVGYFTGYPITYGALVTGLLPVALLFAFRRSRLLAGALAAASAALLIFSESRSAWVAVIVMLLLAVALLARVGNFRALALVGAAALIVLALVLGTGSLHNIVERKLNANITSTDSVTHRQWSYGYALGQFEQRPVFGAGAPGFSALESANATSIGAIDNGYLSISVDMGLIGLLTALIPILVALRVLWRCLHFGVTPPLELALALGILGMAVVTVFYDSFYWAQIDLLLGAMGGMLSVRIRGIARGPAARAQTVDFTRRRRVPLLRGAS
jgi:hypothetical protein